MANNSNYLNGDEEFVTLDDPFDQRPWYRNVLQKSTLVLIGCMVLALACGFPNTFNQISDALSADTKISASQTTFLTSCGLVGLYFTYPAGILLDHVGGMPTLVIGAVMAACGYIGFGFAGDFFYLMLLCFTLAGFGQGAVFLGALGTGLKAMADYPGTAASLVGVCMSLSMGFISLVISIYTTLSGCSQDYCWSGYILIWAICCMILYSIGMLMVFIGSPEERARFTKASVEPHMDYSVDGAAALKDNALWEEDGDEKERAMSLKQSLMVAARDSFFWALMLAYFCAIGYGILTVSKLRDIWASYTDNDPDRDNWTDYMFPLMSLCIATGTLVSGWMTDFVTQKKIATRATCVCALLIGDTLVLALMGAMSGFRSSNIAFQSIYAGLMLSTGFGLGAAFTLFPAIVGETYGNVNFGAFFGLVQFGSAAASFLIPTPAQAIAHAAGGYAAVQLPLAVVIGISAVALFFAGMRKNKKRPVYIPDQPSMLY